MNDIPLPIDADEFEETPQPLFSPDISAIPMPGIRRMVNIANGMDDVIHLSIGQPDFPTPDFIVEAYVEALQAGQTGYTLDAGLPELLSTLAEHYSERYKRELTEDNFLVTTGATEAMYLALTGTAAPGRQFLITDPTFVLYAPHIRMKGGEVKIIPTNREENHQLDPQRIIDAIDTRTFAIVLNTPGNPTGAVYPRETMEAIIEEAAYRGIYVFCDEVYENIVFDEIDYPSIIRCATDLDHIMAVNSFSKTYSMAGLRIGWIVSSQGAIRKLRRYHMFTTTVANTPAQWAGVAALRGGNESVEEMVAEYQRRRDRVVDLVDETPYLHGYRPQGAFYLLAELPENVDGRDVAMRLLQETGVCTVPGDAFGDTVRNTLRISYSASMDEIEEAFARMKKWFGKQKFEG